MERNTKLFYLIAEAIEEEPEMHNQSVWMSRTTLPDYFIAGRQVTCGTVQCVNGWAHAFAGKTDFIFNASGDTPVQSGADLLGLSYGEAFSLFHSDGASEDYPTVLREIGDGAEVEETLEKFGFGWTAP